MEVIYNGYRFVKDKKTGYYLSTKKIDGKRERLHRYVYRCEVGDILPGTMFIMLTGTKITMDPKIYALFCGQNTKRSTRNV